MIPVSTLYDEYIDGPKFTEQKKPIWVYSSPPPPPPPLKRGRNNKAQTHENRSVFKIPKKDSHFNLLQTLIGDQAMM